MREGARPIVSLPTEARDESNRSRSTVRVYLVVLAAIAGLGLMTDSLWRSSATYDEVLYLQVAARWWRTGDQLNITGAGSPLLFWKLQQVPMLCTLDCLGYGEWIDRPDVYEARLLPLARTSGLLIWLTALGLVAYWSRRLYGPDAMVLASWWFVLSPNLLAHGALVTMELPVLAAMTAMFLLFWKFLRTGSRREFVASAVVGGIAFSCKFTTAVVPPILGILWLVRRRVEVRGRPVRTVLALTGGMAAYVAILLVSDVVFTAGALLPISGRTGRHPSLDGRLGATAILWVHRLIETPVPQDWVGFAKQMIHQRSGAPGYLMGEVRESGWRYY
ncbi:MAG: ArnT family glycosyltransferase, partial [Isosphaeraceae bacterium]